MTTDKDQNIWKWKNTVPITKTGIETIVALASLAGAITTILIATKVIAGPASLAFVASPAGIAVLFIAAVYFAAAAYASYQQMQKNEEIGVNGTNGKDGKDANFAILVDGMLKSGTIVEETEGENVKQVNLKLSKDDYQALTNGKKESDEVVLHVLSAGKSVEVKFNHVAAVNDGGNYKVQLTSVNSKNTVADTKTELDIADSKSLKVAVSDKDLEALKNGVSTKLGEVAVNAAISKAQAV